MLRNSVLYSTILHVAVVTVGFFGLPHIRKPPPTLETPILVELVQDVAVTNLPTRRTPPPKKKVEKKPEPKKAEPKKEVKKAAPPRPKPKPKAAPPKQEVVALPPPKPEPKPKPKAKPKPKPKPKPVAKPKPKPKPAVKTPQRLAKVRPRRKPKPPDPFASVLRTVENIKRTPPPKKEAEKKRPAPKKKKAPSFDEQIAKALSRQPREFDRKRKVGINYQERLIGSIKQQLKPCWIIAAGARNAGTLSVEIKVELALDGNVLRSSAVNRARMVTDGFYRAAAEAALRAVSRESKCTPLRLPREDYDLWRELVLNFNPAEALGK